LHWDAPLLIYRYCLDKIHLSIDFVNCVKKHSFDGKETEIITKKQLYPEKIGIKLEVKFNELNLNQVLWLVVSAPFRWMS
jgi:hypothetical protein